MRKLKGHRHLVLAAGLFVWAGAISLCGAAEEEVSTTTTSGPSATLTTTQGSTPTTTQSSAVTADGTPTAPAPSGTQPSGVGQYAQPAVEAFVTVVGGYDDNVNTSKSGRGSSFTNGKLDVAYALGSPRFQLTLDGSAGGTYYYQHLQSQDYDIDLHGNVIAKYKASPRLTLTADLLGAYLTEPSFNYAIGSNFRNGNYFYSQDKLSAQFQWTQRFSTLTRYTATVVNYESAALGLFEDRVENLFGNEFRFLVVPTTTLVAEYRYGLVNYTHGPLDSKTQFVLAGLDHTFNPRLTGTLRGGAEFRSYDEDGDRPGPYVESAVTYAAGRRTSVSWTTRYGIEEPDLPGVQSRTAFRTGLQAKFNVTPRVAATGAVYYDHSDYHSFTAGGGSVVPFTQNSIQAELGLRFAVNSYLGVTAGYNHTEVTSDISGFEYSRNRYFAGLNVVF